MDEPENVETRPSGNENRFTVWVKKYAWAFSLGFGGLAMVFLFTNLFTYEITLSNDSTIQVVLHFWDLFGSDGFNIGWLVITILVLLALGAVLPIFRKRSSGFATGSAMAFLLAFCFLILSRQFYVEASGNDGVVMAFGTAYAAIFAVFGALSSLIASYQDVSVSVQDIAEDSILIALSFGLSYVKIPIGATGGSINLQMLPLFFLALRHGPARGFLAAGVIYGLLTCFTDGYGFATYPFDYLIGFGSATIFGFFRKWILVPDERKYTLKGELFIVLAGVLSTLVRMVGSVTSSMVVYQYDFAAALAYNAVYIPVSGAVSVAVLMALYGPLSRVNNLFPAPTRIPHVVK